MSTPYEGGIRPNRLGITREEQEGVTPENPEFLRFSDAPRTFEPVLNAQAEEQLILGSADPLNHPTAVEQHQITVEYDFQRFFVDGTGDPLDPSYDAFMRDANNAIPNSHTVVRRMLQFGISPESTVEGETGTSKDTRQYYVGRGAKANATITGDPSTPLPDLVTLEYEAEKGRLFQIDQPEDEAITVQNDSDEEVVVTLESEGSSKSTDLTVEANTSETTLDSDWDDLDAVALAEPTSGNVYIQNSAGEDLMVLWGANEYNHGEGDIGVPPVGTGGYEGEIGTDFAIIHSGKIESPAGEAFADNINSMEVSVTNNFDTPDRAEGGRRRIVAGTRNTSIEGAVFGETEEYNRAADMLRNLQQPFLWEFRGFGGNVLGTLQIDRSQTVEVSASEEAGQGVKISEMTINGHGVTLNPVI